MKIRYLVSTAGLALGLGFSIAAQAQSAQNSADSDDATVGEIIVTANKREQSINKVGLAITAVTGETLAQQRVVKPKRSGKYSARPQLCAFGNPDAGVYTARRGFL